MLSFINFDNETIIGMRVSGKLTDAEYDSILERINQGLKKHPTLRLYTEFENFDGTALENYFKDLKFGIKNWNRFEKSAVVTEKKWIKNLSSVADKFFPNVKVKGFYDNEKELAQIWIRNP